MVSSEYEGLVDVFLGCDSLFEESDALVEERHQGFVDYETRLVLGLDYGFSERLDETAGCSDGCLGGLSSLDQFYQLHCWYGVEEVEAENLVGSVCRLREPGDAYRRSIRGEDSILRRVLVDCREYLLLDLRILKDRLDHHARVLACFTEVGSAVQFGLESRGLVLGKVAPCDRAVDVLLDSCESSVEEFLILLYYCDSVTGCRGSVSYA